MKVSIKYNGGLGAAIEAAENLADSIVSAAAMRVANAAREACPVDTGALRDSITVTSDGKRAVVSANTDYAAYVEFGTSKQPPKPFLAPALINCAGALTDITGGNV